jgi:Phage tail tube protein, GTA-gp10
MAKNITLPFGGAAREFRLAIGQLRELQDKCQAGPATILARLMSYQPQASDTKRPRHEDFEFGALDPDFLADMNVFGLVRSIGGDWRVDDVRETIRLGLIGGGMTPTDAYVAVTRYVDERPLTENIGVAAAVLIHALRGDENDPVGKSQPEMVTTSETDA